MALQREASFANSIIRLQDHLYRAGIRTADSRLDCSLFILYSIHKQIPFADSEKYADLNALRESGEDLYCELYSYVEPFIHDPRYYYILREEFMDLTYMERENYESFYPQAISFLFQYTYERYGRQNTEYWQPAGLSHLIAEILNQHEVQSVYNPFAGTASVIRHLRKDIRYVAQEISDSQIVYAKVLIDAYKTENVVIRRGDSFIQWERGHFDAIYANMPWGLKIVADGGPRESSDAYFLRRASEDADISVGVYPIGILFRGGNDGLLRRTLIDRGYIETIIFLPSKLFANTSISTCIIVTNRANPRFGEIQYIDATNLVRANFNRKNALDVPAILSLLKQQENSDSVHWVSCDAIRNNDYNLLVGKSAGKTLTVPEGYTLYTLRDLCSVIHNRAKTQGEGHIIRMTDLANTPDDVLRTVKDFPIEQFNKGSEVVGQDALLLGTVAKLKPTHFSYDGEEAYIKSNVLAFAVKEDIVSIPYLVGELNKDYVKDQIYSEGSYVSHISRRNIMELRILVPSKAKQDAEVSARISSVKKQGEKALADEAAAFKAEVHNRKHDIMTYMQNFLNGLDLLDIYALQIAEKNLSTDIAETATMMRNDYRMMFEQLEHFADDDEFGVPANLDLVAALRKQEGVSGNCEIRVEVDEAQIPPKTKAIVSIASVDFNRLLTNIVGNAKRHGFTDTTRKDYEILIKLSADQKKDLYIIDFCNNGTPFPVNMDKFRYGVDGEKAGVTAGSGKGGNRVKKICQHYHGDYDLGSFNENGQTWTYIRVMLPMR